MYHIIINPASRSGRGAKIWAEQVEPALKAGNTEYQTYFSGKAGEVRQLAAQIDALFKELEFGPRTKSRGTENLQYRGQGIQHIRSWRVYE